MEFRKLSLNDYAEYIQLINEFRPSSINEDAFKYILDYYSKIGEIWLAIENSTQEIVGTGTIIYEHKFINNGGIVGHIEDIIIAKKHSRKGYGSKMIEYLRERARIKKCYKVILNCSNNIQKFYEKCGFFNSNLEMEFRF